MERFDAEALPFIYLSAVVVREVLSGATTARKREDVERTLVGPFLRRGRILTPSFGAWREAGRVLGDLFARSAIPSLSMSDPFAPPGAGGPELAGVPPREHDVAYWV